MAQLNPQQQSAVETVYGPLLVLAGAGSGKTRVITHRIQHMIEAHKISASHILALSFTNKSAREMKERLRKMIGKRLRGIYMGTFHSLGVQILKSHIEELGYRNNFSILSAYDSDALMVDILKNHKLSREDFKPAALRWIFSQAKNTNAFASRQIEYLNEHYDETIVSMFEEYCSHLKSYNCVDFDDLINMPVRLMENSEEIRNKYRRRFKYILIDEFQDTNQAQFDFITLMLGEQQNLMVVGDDDQSIYGWRGADVSLILGFEKRFPGCQVVRLEYNYRSSALILEAANRVIVNNKARHDKMLKTNRSGGEKIDFVHAMDQDHEAELIVDRIKQMSERGIPYGDISILIRTNYQSRAIEQVLRHNAVPYHTAGGYKFFDLKEVKDVLAYLRCIANHKDEISLLRIINYPKRGIGAASIEKIGNYSREHGIDFFEVCHKLGEHPEVMGQLNNAAISAITSFAENLENFRHRFATRGNRKMAYILRDMIGELDWEAQLMRDSRTPEEVKAKMFNVNELISSLLVFEENWEENQAPNLYDYLTRVALQFEEDDSPVKGKVQLMTTHLSKGLEFPVVFIAGVEEELFPNQRAVEEREDGLDEERRLFYVALTRAQDKLLLTACQNRHRMGELVPRQLSRFIDELGDDLLDSDIWDEERRKLGAEERRRQQHQDVIDQLDSLKALLS